MKEIKREKGLTNEQISDWSDLPVSTVAKIFSGETKHPRFETMQALEKMFTTRCLPEYPGPRYDFYPGKPPVLIKDADPNPEAFYRAYEGGTYTADDLDELRGDGVLGELIDGVFFNMASPPASHQLVLMELSAELHSYIKARGGACRVFTAPLDVYLEKNKKTVLQPDILVLCDRNLIRDDEKIWGAPDLVIEILSPSTRRRDMGPKYMKYEAFGVKEYWLVDLKHERVIVYPLAGDDIVNLYTFQDKIPVGIWDGDCVIDFAPIARELASIRGGSE